MSIVLAVEGRLIRLVIIDDIFAGVDSQNEVAFLRQLGRQKPVPREAFQHHICLQTLGDIFRHPVADFLPFYFFMGSHFLLEAGVYLDFLDDRIFRLFLRLGIHIDPCQNELLFGYGILRLLDLAQFVQISNIFLVFGIVFLLGQPG